MRQPVLLLSTAFLAVCAPVAGQEADRLVINELMQSNVDCLMDDLNEFPDSWVELYNPGEKEAQLGNYSLGATPDATEAWTLPDATIPPQMRVLIYCDKVGEKFHTPFRLESGKGGAVWLFRDGQPADSVTGLPKQPAPNIAYGRQTDGSDTWGYQPTPTPGAANCGTVCDRDHLLGDPLFSEPGRVTTGSAALQLTLSLPEGAPEGAQIRYTLDGTEPTAESRLYTSPLAIARTQVVRARLFCEGWLSPRAVTQSYIFFPRAMTLPVISLVTDKRYLDDARIGIFTNNTDKKRNNWRRPVNLELFDAEGRESSLNQLCETRIAGAASRGASKKSMALYAHKRFGTKRFAYEFFPDQKPGLTDFKSVVLRNAGNDFDYLYMRDAIVQRTMATHTDLDWQAWQPAVIYINGQYHGMLNIRERANEHNVYTNYAGLDDVDLIENWWDLKEGTWDHYNSFKQFYSEKGHTMAEYESWMDCGEFADLMIMNLYYNNYDFPGNNIVMWRPRTDDGRWRWIAKDCDFTMGLYGDAYNYKILEWLHNPSYDWGHNWGANSYDATRLFRRLMEDPDFNRLFIDRCAVYMGDFLNLEGTQQVWDPMRELIRAEYPSHRRLINQWWPNYDDEIRYARSWLSQRTAFFYKHLGEYYKLGTPVPLAVNPGLTDAGQLNITFNGISLSEGRFDGQFYPARTLTLEARPESGADVYGWRVTQTTNGSVSTHDLSGRVLSMEMPQCSRLVITAITDHDPAGISTTVTDETPADVYDLSGRMVRSAATTLDGLPRGIYVVRGRKVVW